jgi:hypothetical protein
MRHTVNSADAHSSVNRFLFSLCQVEVTPAAAARGSMSVRDQACSPFPVEPPAASAAAASSPLVLLARVLRGAPPQLAEAFRAALLGREAKRELPPVLTDLLAAAELLPVQVRRGEPRWS